MKKLPPLPKTLFSVLGPIPVALVPGLDEKEKALGITRFQSREIGIQPGMTSTTQWQTFWHEASHVALYDGGVNDALTHEQEEAVCNAVGTYLAAAMQAGYITVNAAKHAR